LQEISISTFDSLGLAPELLKAVAEQGYTTPTPIQAQAIPVVLAGKDLLGAAQTGTGKTAGFTLPLLQILNAKANASHSPARHPIRALVITPTRELCAQVEDSVRTYGKYVKLKSITVYGGVNINPQIDQLRRGVDILVATPGRLLDHVQQKTVDLRQVEILVLDEADRMLDMGFIHDIRKILALLPQKRQNLLFSATFPDEIRTLAKTLLRNAAEIQVTPRNVAAELVSHVLHPVAREKKREFLAYLIQTRGLKQVLVFTATRIGANRLAHQLRLDHIQADAIHGDKTQAEREAALADFKAGKTAVLVATDVASRGLDIEDLPQVINFDVPRSPEDYVHRIGRTGRAGQTGEAISLVAPEDMESLAAIERLIKKRIERVLVPGFQPSGATVATLMGDQPSRRRSSPNVRRDRPPAKPADPIFSQPYEPGSSPQPAAPKPEAPREGPKRKQPQVAALLGGLKRA
jgi:ATP-dependent RNA helicase RhlE